MINETENKPVDLSRRRLAKGGLAAPIVLASLVSKNALANPAYRCTISGQLSNNYSPVPADGTNRNSSVSCDLGSSVENLRAGTGWGNVNKNAKFNTIFKDVYFKKNEKLRSNSTGSTQATFHEVMTIDVNSSNFPPHDIPLARAAIAAYVGYVAKGVDYPLTLDQIKGMFDYAYRNVEYPFPGPTASSTKARLDRNEVFNYFTFLTGGPLPGITP